MDDRIQKALINRHIMKELLQELEPFVYRTSYHLTGHREDAEDISQEVLYKICTKLHTFKGDSSLRTWVYSLVAIHAKILLGRRQEIERRHSPITCLIAQVRKSCI